MDHISTLLSKVLRQRGLQKQASASLVKFHAQQWLLEHLPDFSSELALKTCKDQTLLIAAHSSIAAQECQQKIPDLLGFLQSECDEAIVQNIRIIRAL